MKINFLNKIDLQKSSLIDYANLKSGILKPQKNFVSHNEFFKYKKNYKKGVPILLPVNKKIFDNKNYFLLKKEEIAEIIFSTKNTNYVGLNKFFFKGNKFTTNGKPKKSFSKTINDINSYNLKQKKIISRLSKNKKKIVAFQTRNFPHLGHEAIINYLLKKVDYVIVNPLIGPKKTGDANYEILLKAYEFLINKKFGKRVMILPIIANMFYAGPREACHHAIIRKNLGFTHFLVGRDHAGAENIYKSNKASQIAKKNEDKLKIKIININGAVYCKKCNKSVIKGNCIHKMKDLVDISGTKFRASLKNKKFYKYADYDLQKYLNKMKKDIFQK